MYPKISEALIEALSAGFQLEPSAIELLESTVDRIDVASLLKKVLQNKITKTAPDTIISKRDLEEVLSPLLGEEDQNNRLRMPVAAEINNEIEVLKDPTLQISPQEGLNGYTALFVSRLAKLQSILKQRPDGNQVQQISRVRRIPSQNVKVAGLVMEKRSRRNSLELTIDDESGSMNVAVTDQGVRKIATELLMDQMVIADVAFTKSGVAIAKNLFHPDLPDRKPSYSKKHVYAVLTSDIHVGSKTFLSEAFQRFILWLSGRSDDPLIPRIKYLIIAGDVVDGVGIYPDQDRDLEDKDVRKQFMKLANFLEQVPKYISILITPGNHDPVRQALPQPSVSRDYANPVHSISNVTMLGGPAYVKIHGVTVLVYHGRSLDDVVATTPGLSYSRPAAAMKLLLKARHLAPIYGGRTPIAPEKEDHLVIDTPPDIFHAGHVHVLDRDEYRGTLILNSGAWQSQTNFQANMGIEPTPGIVPIVDMSTFQVVTRDFNKPLG